MESAKTVIFLDRDGVINKKMPPHTYVTRWDQFEFLPGVFEAVKHCNDRDAKVFIVTNQAGISKGIITLSDMDKLHRRMEEIFKRNGARIDGVFVCPHKDENRCKCRKPLTGLFTQAEERMKKEALAVDKGKSWMIGDDVTDILAGKTYGINTVLVEDSADISGDSNGIKCYRTRNLLEAVKLAFEVNYKGEVEDKER